MRVYACESSWRWALDLLIVSDYLALRMKMPSRLGAALYLFLLAAVAQPSSAFAAATTPNPGLHYYYPAPQAPVVDVEADVVIYGGTSGGVVAAVQAVRMGKTAVLVVFGRHVGGMTSGGLTQTDGVSAAVQGGITREYFNQTGDTGFKPSKAEQVFESMLADPIPGATHDAPIPVYYEQRLASVEKRDGRIISMRMENGSVYRGKIFIDCSYEGDLLGKAGVSYTYGREPGAQYGESFGGKRTPKVINNVSPYLEEGNPASGLIYNLRDEPPGTVGSGDDFVQAFNFRMNTVQNADPSKRLPLFQPAGYDPTHFELVYRYHRAGGDTSMSVGNDINNNEVFGPNGVSTDHTGSNRWPDGQGGFVVWHEADYATRERIYQNHIDWQLGMLWYLKNDARYRALATDMSLSATIRGNIQSLINKVDQLGLGLGEYPETSGWPHELYVREARRMVSDLVVTQAHCVRQVIEPDSVGLGNYMMDSHSVRRIPGPTGTSVLFEGGMGQGIGTPWRISYRALVPKKAECENLLVSWAISISHVAFCSMRMEPCFMVLSQSAATAAAMAIDGGLAVQDVDYQKLKLHLLADGQLLGTEPPQSTGIVVDNSDATGVTKAGTWNASSATTGFHGPDYLHDGNSGAAGGKSVTFTPILPEAGNYTVYTRWTSGTNRASNAPIDVIHTGGVTSKTYNQQENNGAWVSLGAYAFAQGTSGSVVVKNDGADGYVVADAVRFVKVGTAAEAVHLLPVDPIASESDGSPGRLRFVRESSTVSSPLTVSYSVGGSAVPDSHYQPLSGEVIIPAGKMSVDVQIVPISDAIAQGPRTVVVTLQSGGSAYSLGSNQTATITIDDKPFDAWRHTNFAPHGEENASASAPNSDPDSDGLSNEWEFLLGGDPLDGQAVRTPEVQMAQDGGRLWLVMHYWRSGAARALNPSVQFSEDLSAWVNAPGVPETLFYEPSTGDRLFEYAEDVTGLSQMFVRLSLR